MLARGRSYIWYSRPDADDREGQDYNATGRLGMKVLQELRVPRDGDFYLCGPSSFLGDLMMGLTAWGVPPDRIHSEVFSGGPSLMPGVISSPVRAPHQPAGTPGAGPLVSFARTGIWSCIGKWTGVPLKALLDKAELKPSARYIVFYCADDLGQTGDDEGKYYESVALVDAFHPQTILAYAAA